MDPEDGKGILKRNQKKKLETNVAAMEDQDVAMWSTFMGLKPRVPRGFKLFFFELFCGAAVLTVFVKHKDTTCVLLCAKL